MTIWHETWCPLNGMNANHEDAAKRCRDAYNLHRVGDRYGSVGKWMAVALNDGSSDGELYSSKSECMRYQHHNEQYYTYIRVIPSGMTVCEAAVKLSVARRLYDKGLRETDPDDRNADLVPIPRPSIETFLEIPDNHVVWFGKGN